MTGDGGPAPTAQTLAIAPGRGEAPAVRLAWSEKAAGAALCLVLFLAHLAFGAARREIAFGLTAAQGLMLGALLAGCPWARAELARARALAAPAIAFALVLLAALWSLTPLVPGGPQPIWAYVQAAPAAALDRSAVLLEMLRLAGLGCAFLYAWLVGADDARARWCLNLLVIFTGAFAAWAFVSHLADPGVLFGSIALPYASQRLSAAFLSANTAATVFGMGLVLSAAALVQALRAQAGGGPRGGLQRAGTAGAAAAFCAACLLLTQSRGGFAAGMASLGVLLVWEARARRWRLFGLAGLGLAGVIAALAALAVLGGGPLLERLASVGAAPDGRGAIGAAHWGAFLSSPWLGYGLGGFDAVNRMVTTRETYPVLWNVHAVHNVYLQWLEEAGVIGAAAMFAAIGLVLAGIWRGAGRRRRMTTWIRGLAAASLVALIHGATDFGLQVPSVAFELACLLGLAGGLAMRGRGRAEPAGGAWASGGARRALAVWGTAGGGFAAAALAAVCAIEIGGAASAASARPLNLLPTPASYDAQAARALERGEAARARALSLKALALRPVDGRAWLTVAAVDARAAGRLTPAAAQALQRAYDVAPYDPELLRDRVALAYQHWEELPADLRDQVRSEIAAGWGLPLQTGALMAATGRVTDPRGRLALAMELFRLRVADAAARSRTPRAPQ